MKQNTNRKFIRPMLLGTSILLYSAIGMASERAYKDGEHVFKAVCSHCHELGNGPKIKGRALPIEYIKIRVRNGFRAMPAFRASNIDDKSLQLVAELIRDSSADKVKE
ncbi:MAG: cytochrome c [Colwellia sp.]|nr:cytochrome c [Colwellia sp.]